MKKRDNNNNEDDGIRLVTDDNYDDKKGKDMEPVADHDHDDEKEGEGVH